MPTVLITGANRGIGLELARLYAEDGNTVIATCRDPSAAEGLSALAAAHDVEIETLEVTEPASVAALAAKLEGRPIDVLINNAGIMGPPPEQQSALTMDFDGWAETFAVNAMAPVRIMQALLGNLRAAAEASGESKLMTVTSQMGALSLDMPFAYAYCSSKAALNKFMKMAAGELGKDGVLSAVVHPGWVRTDMGGSGADISPEESAEGIKAVVAGMTAANDGAFWKWNGEQHDW